jgi:hypothetical protein
MKQNQAAFFHLNVNRQNLFHNPFALLLLQAGHLFEK